MVLETLEMQGFKSFPDKTVLRFGSGITAVVGPNGSGKSNISDAVRWVLGETSTKSLRGSKMEDVIFGGTASRKQLGYAQVQLTLNNSDNTLPDKGSTVTIARRYYRSGESEYKIDGETVRRRDIHELFMDTGLGADGYSMVGQGKIDSIISAKNEDRRELFEEAAGISRFRHKRTDAQRRLLQAQENLVRLLDILGELESRVGPLKIQSEKAQKFIDLSAEKKELEIGVWLDKLSKYTDDLRTQEHKIDAAGASYDEIENEIKTIESEIEEVAGLTASINTEIEEIRGGSQEYEESALKCDTKEQVVLTTINHNIDTIERLKSDIQAAGTAKSDLDDRILQRKAFIEDAQLQSSQKRQQLQEVTQKAQGLITSSEEYGRKSAQINQTITSLTLELSDCRVKCSQALSSIEEIESRRKAVDESLAQIDIDCKSIEKEKADSDALLVSLNNRIEENENALEGFKLKLKSKTEKADKIKANGEKLSADAAAKRQKAKMLLDLEKNMEGFSGAVKAVIRHSQSGALGGIHGVLSQLITVDNEYSTAIEVALGAAMQNIVTSTEADAKRAIYYLKQNNIGRATFLPVTNIKGRTLDEHGLDDTYGFIAVASDLVKCDGKYEQIIKNLLGRTVVVDDMDCAIGVAKKYSNRFKIVTLDGQVMNPGGSMSGGARSKGAGVLSRQNTIDELTKEAQSIECELAEVREDYKKASQDASLALSRLQGSEADLKQAQEELIRAQGDFRLIDEKLSSVTAQHKSLTDEKNNADARIDLFTKAADDNQKQSNELQLKIDTLQNELASITDTSDDMLAKREELRAQTEKINLELVTIAKDAESAKLTLEELERTKLLQTDKVNSTEDEISELEGQNAQLKAEIESIKAEAQSYRDMAKSSDCKVKEKIEQRNNLEKRSGVLRLAERDKSQDREKLSAELVRLDERKNTMQKEFDELSDKLYEQYELTRLEAAELQIEINDMAAAKKRLAEIKNNIRKLGSINVAAVDEYKEVSERYEFLKQQISDIEKSRNELNKIIDDLTVSMSEKFLAQFNRINNEFKVCFSDFFGGGKGELLLEDSSNCLESAIEIKIQPPGKSVQNINLFSGGEKSLAAMALLFSVLKVTPAPFCIYDEVEAALDDVNVERFAKYMRRMTDKTQFIAITHRRGTMEEADILYGVTMQEKGVSKLLELQSAELAAKMGLED